MKKKWIIIGVLSSLILASYLIWLDASRWSLHRYQIKSELIQNTQLPASFKNIRIVFISDLHAYAQTSAGDLEKILLEVNKLAPDILLFGGDLIDAQTPSLSEDQINEVSNFLKLMDAPLGKFAVLGLDDLNQVDVIREIYGLSDFELLENRSLDIFSGSGKHIILAGLSPDLSQSSDISFLLPDNGSFTILISALPDIVTRLADQDADLVLSGSTHGGQVNIPLVGPLYRVGDMRHVAGKFKLGARILIVSNGLSTSKFHYRLFADPDMLSIRLLP